uniref:PH domain-containing protein n=1 Tax=Parascaris equorum TaxID=6256 RepID=A0A914RKR6_PAREQ
MAGASDGILDDFMDQQLGRSFTTNRSRSAFKPYNNRSDSVEASECAILKSACDIEIETDDANPMKVASFNSETELTRDGLANFVKLVELEKELNGIDNLVQPNRVGFYQIEWFFLCVSALTNFLYWQQIFRLFEDGDAYHVTNDPTLCLTIYGGNRSLVLSANSTAIKDLWLEEIAKASRIAKETKIEQLPRSASIKPATSNDDLTAEVMSNDEGTKTSNADVTNPNGRKLSP